MIRLRALNEESSEESEGDEEIPTFTKEAQEQAAFSEYNSALKLIQEKKLKDAQIILEDLLNSDILAEVTKENVPEGFVQPGLALKYSCLKNLGSIHNELEERKAALESYLKAAELDDTDVTLWYRIALIAVKELDYELACDAYLEGLRCSPCHWPCLEGLITILYVLNDYIGCLMYISRGLELDADFLKGLVIRDQILKEQPSIAEHFELFCKGCNLGSLKEEYDSDIAAKIINEVQKLREARHHITEEAFNPKPIPAETIILRTYTWQVFGEAVLKHHRKAKRLCAPIRMILADPNNIELKEKNEAVTFETDQRGVTDEDGDNDCGEDDDGGSEQQQQQQGSQSEGEDPKSRKRRRSQMAFMEQWMWGGKRRSARVRSTIKKEAEREDGNFEEALRRLVPPSLLPNNMKESNQKNVDNLLLNDDSMDTMDLYKLFERRESVEGSSDDRNNSQGKYYSKGREGLTKILEEEGYFGTDQEENDVKNVVESSSSCDVIDLLMKFITILSSKWNITWPLELIPVYLEMYKCLREHVKHPSVFAQEEGVDIKADTSATILYLEICLDKSLNDKTSTDYELLAEKSLTAEGLGQLTFLSIHEDLFGSGYMAYIMRILWMKAHLYLHLGNVDIAIQALDTLLCHIEGLPEEEQKQKILLPNCQHHNIITKDGVSKLLTTLIRNQSLGEVQRLYDEQHYEQLTEILQETFRYQQPNNAVGSPDNCPDRATQLAMLMDALWQLKKYQECFYWGEACCNEAFQKYLGSEDKEQQKWASTIEKLLAGLESCVTKAGLSVVDSPRLPRLVQNLMHMLCHQLEAPETAVEMPIETVTPWILLQQIIQWEEEKNKENDKQKPEEAGKIIPNHISFLFTAHEHLAKHSWCCCNEGALLLHTMDVVIPRIHTPELCLLREQLLPSMEQIFYCLYAHPSKKTKARYLQDHGVPQITMTWDRAMQLFQFYKPMQLPEFDSYRVASITADVEVLFKRIIQLVPQQSDPVLLVDRMSQYIEGHLKEIPCPPSTYVRLSPKIASIYYLLGDYYFKNNDWPKAIRHYLLDVCVNPVRLDSWAGMALARGSQLETRLNSCEHLKSESEFLRQSEAAYRCFKRSLEIDTSHSLLWIEKGNFVYMVHSFCSRLLKQETDSLSMEKFTMLEEQKERMLDVADSCFNSAIKVWCTLGPGGLIQDERWLLHYMLGKVAEKKDLDQQVILDHYVKSSKYLEQMGANYARKIIYNNPQNLAVEALEVFYRIHASILKYLEQNEGRQIDDTVKALFEQKLQEAASSSFMVGQIEPKIESEEERKKRPAEDQIDNLLHHSKRRCVDESVELSVMEDVINLMEDMISKVADNETYIPEEPFEPQVPLPVSGNAGPRPGNVKSSKMDVVVISDDSVDLRYHYMKNGPGKIKTENYSPKVEPNLKTELNTPSDTEDDRQNSMYYDIPLEMEVDCDDDEDPYGLQTTTDIKSEMVSEKCDQEGLPADSEVTVKKNNEQEVPEEVVLARRSSQESTTTTTTTTTRTETSTSAADSSNSSDDSSSSDRDDDSSSSASSDSSDSSDSDSEDPNRSTGTVVAAESDKKDGKMSPRSMNMTNQKKKEDTKCDHYSLIRSCLIALEECVLRFPHHYKSLYRLTHYYFHSKFHRNVSKCRELLLGIYTCLPAQNRPPGSNFQGLFADRKSTNFFNGVWRIPVPEIDRPGCFASHMSRCILLLMDVLRELHEHSLLLELCVALRRTPEPDKKYLRESEREQLSRQALSLSLQTLRAKLRNEITSALALEVYRTYQYVQKQLPHKESTFSALLKDVCKRYVKAESCTLEQAVRICQQEIVRVPPSPGGGPAQSSQGYPQPPTKPNPAAAAPIATATPVAAAPVSAVPAKKPTPAAAPAQTAVPKAASTAPTAPRPRGRPPGSTRAAAQAAAAAAAAAATAPPVTATYSSLHSMLNDPHSFLNISSMMDPLNAVMQAQMTGFQAELLRQLAANSVAPVLNPLSGLSGTAASSASAASRERPSVSILPVSSSASAQSKLTAKTSSLQPKTSTAGSSYGKNTPRGMPAAPYANISQVSKTSAASLMSYPAVRDTKYTGQSSLETAPPRKLPETSLQSLVQPQISGPGRKPINKQVTSMITYKHDVNVTNKSGIINPSDKVPLNTNKMAKSGSPSAAGKSTYKLQSAESKDPTYFPRSQNSESSRSAVMRASARAPHVSAAARNVLNDISASHSAGISMLNRLQQHSTQLEVIHKPKTAALDLPSSVSIPSSITITPKKCSQPSSSESKSPKKMKDTVSIVEIGNAAQRSKSSGQNVVPKTWSPSASSTSSVKEKEKEGSNVEVITLE